MILIGEKLNASVPSTKRAFEQKDEQYFADTAKRQARRCAYVDVNAGMFADEADKLLWAVGIAAKHAPVSVDSSDPDVIAYVLKNIKLDKPLINSISPETARFQTLLPLVKQYNCSVVALPVGADGIAKTTEERVSAAASLINALQAEGVKQERIFADIVVEAASVDWLSASVALSAARQIREMFPNVHQTCGLSNISFGLPNRKVVNNAMITAAILNGVDSAILDVLNDDVILTVRAAELLAGYDEYGMEYITAFRELL